MPEVYPCITRDQLPQMLFVKEEVLLSQEKIKDRAEKILKAAQRGKFFNQKSTVIFETEKGARIIHASIWEATDRNILFMDGIALPVCCIREVTVAFLPYAF